MANHNLTKGDMERWDAFWQSVTGSKSFFKTGDIQGQRYQLYRRKLHSVMKCRDHKGGLKSCELGSGRGTLSMYLASEGHSCTLVDSSVHALVISERNMKSIGQSCELIHRMADCTGLPDRSFDLVHSAGLIEHYSMPEAIFDECRRLLRPGGLQFHIHVGFNGGNDSFYRNSGEYAGLIENIEQGPESHILYLWERVAPPRRNRRGTSS